jgi:DNA polymerase-3 subunit alpha
MEEFLKDTYGITVYQEQVMLLSQKLANFTKGDADVLRKAMGKKDRKTLDKLKPQFIENAKAKGLPEKKLEKIWTDWEAFASYAFNKSHSTCYAFVAYQTAYLKTHYPGEYMAAVLTSSLGNIEKITFFMEECKRMGVPVLGPDVNESSTVFDVNKAGQIRFGLGAIKGAGEAAIGDLIQERTANGPYKDIFDLTKRVNLRTVNKKTFESLAYAGAFDEFGLHRAQYFMEDNGGTLLEKAIKYGNQAQSEKGKIQVSLFGGADGGNDLPPPRVPVCEPWTEVERLKYEKDVVGFYISGHPLDQYRVEMTQFAITPLDQVENYKNRDLNVAGIVSKTATRMSKSGNPFAVFTLEDYSGSLEIALFGDNYVKFANYLQEGGFLYVKGKYEPRYYGSADQFEFRPQQMQLLAEMRQKHCKGLQLNLDLAYVDANVAARLAELAKAHPGDCELRVCLNDPSEKIQTEGKSRLFRINPSNELIKQLETMRGVAYRLVW